MTELGTILSKLKSLANPENVAGMARFGINPSKTYGISIPNLRRIVGMRNRIIHGYDSVDDELLWQTIQTHVPPLAQQLSRLLESDDG